MYEFARLGLQSLNIGTIHWDFPSPLQWEFVVVLVCHSCQFWVDHVQMNNSSLYASPHQLNFIIFEFSLLGVSNFNYHVAPSQLILLEN